jgi:hypothetical protein
VGPFSDLRLGAYVANRSATIETGDPGFPELHGKETGAELVWRVDTQDSPVVAARGVHSQVRLLHIFNGAELGGEVPSAYDSSFTQLSGSANEVWSISPRNRLFVYGAFGTSFDAAPLPLDQFALGAPFRLGAYASGELRGAHGYAATAVFFDRSVGCQTFSAVRCSQGDGWRTVTHSTTGATANGGRTAAPASSWTRSSVRWFWQGCGGSTAAGART